MKRPRLTRQEREARQREALDRAQSGFSRNDALVVMEFEARGIPAEEISPRENVLTFEAWRALGRHVRKGEKAVKLTVWIPIVNRDKATGEESIHKRPKTACVFHVSQTDPDDGKPVAVVGRAMAEAFGMAELPNVHVTDDDTEGGENEPTPDDDEHPGPHHEGPDGRWYPDHGPEMLPPLRLL